MRYSVLHSEYPHPHQPQLGAGVGVGGVTHVPHALSTNAGMLKGELIFQYVESVTLIEQLLYVQLASVNTVVFHHTLALANDQTQQAHW
jgi:hypothetical protein